MPNMVNVADFASFCIIQHQLVVKFRRDVASQALLARTLSCSISDLGFTVLLSIVISEINFANQSFAKFISLSQYSAVTAEASDRCGIMTNWLFKQCDFRFDLFFSFSFSFIFPVIFTALRYASAVLAVIVCLSVCLSVRPSQVGVVQRWLNLGSD